MNIAAGLLLASASTLALNWGWVAQHGAAGAMPALTVRRPLASLRTLFGDRSWLRGFLVGILGWALYVAALALAPLSLVQTVSAGGIGLLALLARRRGETVSARDALGAGLATAGLALLGLSLAGGAAADASPRADRLAAWLLVSAAAAAVAAACSPGLAAGASLGVAAGILYAGGDVATKAATFPAARFLLVPLVLALDGLAFVALQQGFQRGRTLATAGSATLLANALPIAAGPLLFAERLPGGLLGGLRLAAFALAVLGAFVLVADRGVAARRERRPRARDESRPGGALQRHAVS